MDPNGKLFEEKIEFMRSGVEKEKSREERTRRLDWVGVIKVKIIKEEQIKWIKNK